ncbi:phthiocerol/phthiodiolone dimycocerosyl transferase family protein [Nocardia cyriacigeorgica]|uniref:phthiocerol/phthiodiolone dimycocerosyl transferase family protein n=1 Tax=Nocardia cyriacigeorgica TaxID=135487 RepID=UPI002810C2D6|nr:acyltransferase [Nocardia cyriacigeorgica]
MLWDEGDVVRLLAPSEQRFVRHGTYTGRSVAVAGRLDTSALSVAFATLLCAYPVLVCRIGIDQYGRGYLLRPASSVPVPMLSRSGDPDELTMPAHRLDPAEQLAYLDVVLGSGDRSRVTMYVHHGVADGGHSVELFARLWDCYTDQITSVPGAVTSFDYPMPLEWFAAQRGIGRHTRSGFEDVARPLPPATSGGGDDAPADGVLVRPRRLHLDPAATARIVELSRWHRVTVNALLTAALLRAYAGVAGGVGGVPVPVGCLYPVDLRGRLSPPVAAAAGTNMAGLASFAADVDRAGCIVELAQRISTRLHEDLVTGTVQQSVLHFPDYFGEHRIHSLAGHIAITNTGVVPHFRTPDTLGVTDYEIVYLSAHPRRSLGPSAAVTFLAYTFAARLTVAMLGGPFPAEDLLGAVDAELTTTPVEVGRGQFV